MRRTLTATAIAAALLAAPSLGGAADPKDAVEYRQAVMSSLGGHAGAIARIVKGKVDYDHIVPHAEAIALSAPLVDDVWPANSGPDDYEKTDALAKIWDEPEKFQTRIDTMKEEAENFLVAAKTDDDGKVIAAFKELGQACGGCHDNYRAE